VPTVNQVEVESAVDRSRQALWDRFASRVQVNSALTRALVSYQSNRGRAYYRWFKYKEGFSAGLIEYLLAKLAGQSGVLLDPFAGSGAALFAARDLGWNCRGIELLPVGVTLTQARLAAEALAPGQFKEAVRQFLESNWSERTDPSLLFRHIRITANAFPKETEDAIASFRTYVRDRLGDPAIRMLFETACLSTLEAVSYTRKDGQYLRWDERASRELRGKRFSKGHIPPFATAISKQLQMMAEDLESRDLFSDLECSPTGTVEVTEGSCLDVLLTLPRASIDVVITSPPYCNRYDYTRTYALELAFLGVNETTLRELRQCLLSCTVENKEKVGQLAKKYEEANATHRYVSAIRAFDQQAALQEVLRLLESAGRQGQLNNSNIPRMVRNYFLESSVVIHELARIVRPNGHVVMVNDNVQYIGQEIPVDLILSDMAEKAGFVTKHIWTLGRGKGNSSQQMGAHGRNELRKCAYVWRKE